ncbi:hypothetical protein GCM10023317_01190 [Actinopolymorpha pittospori]
MIKVGDRRYLGWGLTSAVLILATLAALATGLTSSAGLESLYGWRNGTSTAGGVTLDDIHIFPGFYLLSIQDAIANYRAFATDSRWTPGWLPLFANGGGDFYVLDLTSSSGSPVRHFRIEEPEHPIEFGSLRALLTTLAEPRARSFLRRPQRLPGDG